MKEANFVLRDNGGNDIAKVTFAVRNNVNLILYNDKKNGTVRLLGNWVQYVPYQFRIQVNLDTNKTTVWFNNSSTPTWADVPFMSSADNFSTISADFKGIDSGTMGWDEIKVTRLPDLKH